MSCHVTGHDSEVFLVPRAIYKDPFRGGDNILVLADCYEPPHEDESGISPFQGSHPVPPGPPLPISPTSMRV